MKMSNKKLELETSCGRKFNIDAHEILDNRSTYYAKKDSDNWDDLKNNYQDEYESIQDDGFEIYDWCLNNMNWWECKTLIETTTDKPDLSELEIDGHSLIKPPEHS